MALVTDSTAYLPEELRTAHDIRVVPLHVVIGGRDGREGVDVGARDVAEALRAYTPVTTSRPSPRAFLDAYTSAFEAGAEAVVSVHLSAALSSTIGGAELAATQSPVPVTVVDSCALGMVMGYAVASAADLAAHGAPPHEVAAHVHQRCADASIFFYVDTLEHLRRGGRIGTAGALLGAALAVKPILSIVDGVIVPLERVRTATRSLARIEELAAERVAAARSAAREVDVAVHHLDSPDRAQALAQRLRDRVGAEGQVRLVELGAVVGAHVGPGTIAVAVVPRVGPPRGPADSISAESSQS